MSFDVIPTHPDVMSPERPLLLISDSAGTTYRGQSGGVLCNHPEATGLLYNLREGDELGDYLDGYHHWQWCGSIDDAGLAAIDTCFTVLGIPLRTSGGWHDEGWVSVEVQPIATKKWQYLAPYVGRSGY